LRHRQLHAPQHRSEIVPLTVGLLTAVACDLGGRDVTYVLEGSSTVTGAPVQWLRDQTARILILAAALSHGAGDAPVRMAPWSLCAGWTDLREAFVQETGSEPRNLSTGV
jgi:hypothetical protein